VQAGSAVDLSYAAAPASTSSNQISGFRAEEVSSSQLRISADYYYTGDLDQGSVYLVAYVLTRGARAAQLFTTRGVPISVGRRTATIEIQKYAPDPRELTTTQVEICMQARATPKSFCQVFSYSRTWRGYTPR